ncbi:MAG: TolC family protein [Trueperaceae bacterium]
MIPLRSAWIAVLVLTAAPAWAQAERTVDATSTPAAVATLLEGLAEHPGRRAADALAEAAALRLEAVRQPLSLVLRFDAQRLTVDPAEEPLPPPFDELFAVDAATESLSATLLLRPFLAGDLADLADQRRADAERAALQAREATAQLEAQTIQAALGLWLADLAVDLAAQGEALAAAAAAASERRAAVGGANAVERGDAERALREAAAGLRDARAQRDLATARLATLVPNGAPLAPFALDPVVGVPPDLVRATLDVALAEVGVRNAERGLLPTVEAGYTWLQDDGASFTLSLESRSWQPAVTYQTAGAGGGGNGFASAIPSTAQPTVRGALNVGVAWTLSPQNALEAEAVGRQLDAAVAGLASAHDRARLGQRALEASIAAATDREELARLDLALRTLERDAADARFAAGAIGELERLQAHLGWRRAAFALASARVEALNAVLDTHLTYAQPLSEVLP